MPKKTPMPPALIKLIDAAFKSVEYELTNSQMRVFAKEMLPFFKKERQGGYVPYPRAEAYCMHLSGMSEHEIAYTLKKTPAWVDEVILAGGTEDQTGLLDGRSFNRREGEKDWLKDSILNVRANQPVQISMPSHGGKITSAESKKNTWRIRYLTHYVRAVDIAKTSN